LLIFLLSLRYIIVNIYFLFIQFVLPPSSDGLHFDVHEFTLPPNSQRELTITWKPSVCGNMRKLIKIEQIDNNRKYDFIVLGNCIDPSNKKFKVLN